MVVQHVFVCSCKHIELENSLPSCWWFLSFGVDGLSSHAFVHWFSIYIDNSGEIIILATQIMKYISTGNPLQLPYICIVWSCLIPRNEKLRWYWWCLCLCLSNFCDPGLFPMALYLFSKDAKPAGYWFPIKKHKSIFCFRKDPKKPSSIHFLYSFLRESCLICQAKPLIFQSKKQLYLLELIAVF